MCNQYIIKCNFIFQNYKKKLKNYSYIKVKKFNKNCKKIKNITHKNYKNIYCYSFFFSNQNIT